jgi:predicted TIM-barrel fold metal-dependent hydrolase
VKVIDSHCHVASEEHIPKSFVGGAVANMAVALSAQGIDLPPSKLQDRYLAQMQDPLCDKLVAEMERAGIGHSVLLVPDFTWALGDCTLSIEESFDKHREVLARHPGKFTVFGGVDPRWGADGIDLFERSLVSFGFGGLKVYPPCGFSPSDPSLFPYYELCAHHEVPVLVHIGPTSPALSFVNTNPFELDRAAREFPTVNFILAHGSTSFAEECTMMCRFRPNVYLDVSAYQNHPRDPPHDPIRRLVARGINHKVLFGTDWPVFRLQGNQRKFVEELIDDDGPLEDTSPGDRELFLHGNVERLIGERPSCT